MTLEEFSERNEAHANIVRKAAAIRAQRWAVIKKTKRPFKRDGSDQEFTTVVVAPFQTVLAAQQHIAADMPLLYASYEIVPFMWT